MLGTRLIKGASLFLLGSCMILQIQAAAKCYLLDGTEASSENTLCNPNATGEAGSHSACCNEKNGDACLSTGLCLNTVSVQQSHLLWATACTDPTFKDPSCPQYCQGTKLDNSYLRTCNDTYFCCETLGNTLTTEQCCNQSFKLAKTNGIGTIVAQLKSGVGAIPLATGSPLGTASPTISASPETNSTTATPGPIPSGAVAGLAVEAVILALSLAGLGFMLWRNRLLDKKLKEAEAAAIAARSIQQQQQQQLQQQQYHWQPPPSSHAYSYASPTETETPKLSELHAMRVYPELAGTEIGTELPSEARSPRTPHPE
ncbi:uncharacterized protein F4822DRAFT_140942 [Hypoxylon trugodes]|uniref:uncharacterized protein n=1 Tax=Hypoxylon trugodes TaxID=326681 RepID=UPI00218CFD34|nr:uncharacterized protein F4822DRAFT_140942 [Hypoxylon trugodes]KAI1392786.1 hypothetical protein F4822DRAFT_140942 [Hypoxylon trugodes]